MDEVKRPEGPLARCWGPEGPKTSFKVIIIIIYWQHRFILYSGNLLLPASLPITSHNHRFSFDLHHIRNIPHIQRIIWIFEIRSNICDSLQYCDEIFCCYNFENVQDHADFSSTTSPQQGSWLSCSTFQGHHDHKICMKCKYLNENLSQTDLIFLSPLWVVFQKGTISSTNTHLLVSDKHQRLTPFVPYVLGLTRSLSLVFDSLMTFQLTV